MSPAKRIKRLLCELQLAVLKEILKERASRQSAELAQVVDETAADTIYAIDQVAERLILNWFVQNWPSDLPVEIVMEGLDSEQSMTCFPATTSLEETLYKCIIDPVDGTRGIMYDKRSAWILMGVAKQKFGQTTLQDVEVAVMTEIPTTRQWRADQVSAARSEGVDCIAIDVRSDFQLQTMKVAPSKADEVQHAFGTVVRFFPTGATYLSRVEESLWRKLYGDDNGYAPTVFNDQYISTGGQLYEIMSGRDRFIADLRPYAFQQLAQSHRLACHPYDISVYLIAEELGCIVEKPDGSPLDYPLDTTTPISWVAYANRALREKIQPVLGSVLKTVACS